MITPGTLRITGLVMGVCAMLALGFWGGYRWQAGNVVEAKQERDQARLEAKIAASANASNQTTIKDLRTANQILADERKAQLAEAARMSAELETVRADLGSEVAKNAALRQKMGRENADVGSYLDTGMPCELAVQLWGKQAGYCAN